ncbi:MAG: carboxypeptidase-like regulatory domain-containing protein [Chitinophagales bacterium]|nr:carboxypeptidase-like regulatory domain-containing protein [Chitinophagales bacterium]
MIILILAFILLSQIKMSAQQKFTISGYVKDAASGENMIGTIAGIKTTTTGTATNNYGFYSITLPEGDYTLTFSYLGYSTFDTTVFLHADERVNVNLEVEMKQIEEVIVSATDTKDANVRSAQMGKFDLQMDKIRDLPVIFGEQDILKTIQLLPGVQSGNEGTTGFYVRGGGADQNLLLLDEATVYNASHLFGFFSVFNSDAILNATLYKEGMPAMYGGRISSVLDISMKEGNNQNFHGTGGIGIISSRLTLEGPVAKNKCSFMVSGRRTYFDVLVKPFLNPEVKGSGYFFYDLNAKINYRFSDKDRLFLSGYFGRDVFSYHNNQIDLSIPWGNATTTLRWNHLFSNKLFMNASAIYNAYNFQLKANQNVFEFDLFSGIHDFNAKMDFDYFPSVKHHVQYGANYIYHIFQPQSISGKSGETHFDPTGILKKFAHEGAIYLQDEWDISDKFQLSGGLRFSLFNQVGPYILRTFDPFTLAPIDSTVYRSGEHVSTYTGLEPRLLARYFIGNTSSIKGSFTITNQYIHLVSNNGTTLPTDIWVPSSLVVKPQKGYQYSLGYFRNFKENIFETSIEIYYKKLQNQIEFREGYTPTPNEELEENFIFGKGDSYGAEFYINKKSGLLTGWISYTLSYTNRKFPDLNHGNSFPYRYDRRHNLSIAGSYQLNEKWSLGAEFIYSTGIAYTLPESKYFIEGNVITQYGTTNSYRLASYNRLDVSANYEGKKREKFQSGWSFSIYNLYNRKNPYFIYNEYSGVFLQDPKVEVQAKQVSLFPIIPSVTWNFKF